MHIYRRKRESERESLGERWWGEGSVYFLVL
jgi:hypothetical protein